MDARRFDGLTRVLGAGSSRRWVLGTLAVALGLAPALPDLATAGKRKAKLKKNAFGCVNVGGKCRGKDKNCCSGICKGKKPKRGEKDKSKCGAHDESTCQRGQNFQACGGADIACTTTAGQSGLCTTTTGNAAHCFKDGNCFPCKRDTDCEGVCGQGAACIQCAAACAATGGTGCVGTGECTILSM